MNNRTTKWIETILHEASKLEANKGIEIVQACGKECSKGSTLLDGALKIRDEFRDDKDLEKRFEAYKQRYYNTPNFTFDGCKVTLVLEACTCSMVKNGVSNPYLCNCTTGYSIKVFETLFGRRVEVNLLQSILNGDTICKQEITVSNQPM